MYVLCVLTGLLSFFSTTRNSVRCGLCVSASARPSACCCPPLCPPLLVRLSACPSTTCAGVPPSRVRCGAAGHAFLGCVVVCGRLLTFAGPLGLILWREVSSAAGVFFGGGEEGRTAGGGGAADLCWAPELCVCVFGGVRCALSGSLD